MKKFLLYGHGGAYNHGAEAIVKSTVALLRKQFPNCEIILSTHFKEQDLEFQLPVDRYCERDMRYVALDKQADVKGKCDHLIYQSTLDCITPDTVCLSIGGDNYCYDNWRKWKVIHETALARGAYSILWSCSIEPAIMDKEMIKVLKTHHLITARESITYQALKMKGIDQVKLCADIAFSLDKLPCPLPQQLIQGNTVALNISPLLLRRERIPGILLENIQQLVEAILRETTMNILLIPHVLMPMDNDLQLLQELYQRLPQHERIGLVYRHLTAAAYKFIIAQCRFGIFSRTHASIAAYDSLVPTIVLGYSVKSRGIAADLGLKDYVLPIEEIQESTSVLNLFHQLQQHEEEILITLSRKMPAYRKKAVVSLPDWI